MVVNNIVIGVCNKCVFEIILRDEIFMKSIIFLYNFKVEVFYKYFNVIVVNKEFYIKDVK